MLAGRITINRYHQLVVARMLKVRKLRIFGKNFTTHRSTVSSTVSRHLRMIVHGTSSRFKLISLIFAVLLFFDINAFLSVYNTSQVVREEPDRVKSYTELIEHPKSEPMFFDGVVPQSSKFTKAQKGSLRQAIWEKFKQLKRNHLWRNLDTPARFAEAVKIAATEMIANKSVTFASSIGMRLLQAFYCCLSPESEFWRFSVNVDASENEELTGLPISPNMKGEKLEKFLKQTRRIVESGLITKFDAELDSFREMAGVISGASMLHVKKQVQMCSDDYVHESVNSESGPIPLGYYKTLSLALLALALLYLISEVALKLLTERYLLRHHQSKFTH